MIIGLGWLVVSVTADAAGTLVFDASAGRRRWFAVGTTLFVVSLVGYALALDHLVTSVAEGLFVALGTATVTAIAVRRGDDLTRRQLLAIVALTLGAIILQSDGVDA